MKQVKAAAGIFLIVVSLAGLVFWEMSGRDKLVKEEVLLAEQDIEPGVKITADMLRVGATEPEGVLAGALKKGDQKLAVGKVSRQFIPKNSQVSEVFFGTERLFIKGEQTIFPIREEWIETVSSSVRRGDQVMLYTSKGGEKVGGYALAFVKDSSDREVKSPTGKSETEVLGRIDADAAVSYVEIIAEREDCQRLTKLAESGETFVILQEM